MHPGVPPLLCWAVSLTIDLPKTDARVRDAATILAAHRAQVGPGCGCAPDSAYCEHPARCPFVCNIGQTPSYRLRMVSGRFSAVLHVATVNGFPNHRTGYSRRALGPQRAWGFFTSCTSLITCVRLRGRPCSRLWRRCLRCGWKRVTQCIEKGIAYNI